MGSRLELVFAEWLTALRQVCGGCGRALSSVRITALHTGCSAVRLDEAAERAAALQVERIPVTVDDGPADRLVDPLARIRG